MHPNVVSCSFFLNVVQLVGEALSVVGLLVSEQ